MSERDRVEPLHRQRANIPDNRLRRSDDLDFEATDRLRRLAAVIAIRAEPALAETVIAGSIRAPDDRR